MKLISILSILLHFSFVYSAENSSHTSLSAESSQPITKGHYIGGGVLGTVVGFGLGHAVQARPDSNKMKFFMISEAGVVGGSLFLLIALTSNECTQGGSEEDECLSSRRNRQDNILTAGVLSFVGLRLWEIYDLWSYPYTTDKKSPQAALYIHPQSRDDTAVSLVFNY